MKNTLEHEFTDRLGSSAAARTQRTVTTRSIVTTRKRTMTRNMMMTTTTQKTVTTKRTTVTDKVRTSGRTASSRKRKLPLRKRNSSLNGGCNTLRSELRSSCYSQPEEGYYNWLLNPSQLASVAEWQSACCSPGRRAGIRAAARRRAAKSMYEKEGCVPRGDSCGSGCTPKRSRRRDNLFD